MRLPRSFFSDNWGLWDCFGRWRWKEAEWCGDAVGAAWVGWKSGVMSARQRMRKILFTVVAPFLLHEGARDGPPVAGLN